MTYRDTEDALRARIQALESRLSQRSREQTELREELAQARQDLAALHPVQQVPPAGMLALGVAGCCLAMSTVVLGHLIPLLGYHRWLFLLLHITAYLGLGLGLVGFYKVTGQLLALAAGLMQFIGLAVHLLGEIAVRSDPGPASIAPGWLFFLAIQVVLGLTLLRAPPEHLTAWKRNVTGVLAMVGVLFGALSLGLFVVQSSFGHDGWLMQLHSTISIPSSIVALGKHTGLLLCFLELRRPR